MKYEFRRYLDDGSWASRIFDSEAAAYEVLDWYARNRPHIACEVVRKN